MPDIINPIVIKWANEELRPFAEYTLGGFLNAKEFIANYDDSIDDLLASHVDGDMLDDGRESEGVSRLTKADITGFVNVIKAVQGMITDPIRSAVRKPTVRKISLGG